MALRALKSIKYRGARLKMGDPLEPAPDPTLARQLISGRYAYDDAQSTAQTRPAGTGTGRRSRAARKPAEPAIA
jgi:hypothetical protein